MSRLPLDSRGPQFRDRYPRPRGRQIGVDELEVAVKESKVRLTVPNVRPVHCCCCRILVEEGAGRRLWVDGFCRGFLGPECWKGLI